MSSPELKDSSTISEENRNQPSWSVDADADRLMDDLFSDIDYILENGTEPPKPATTNVQTPSFISLDSLVVPSMVIGNQPAHQSPSGEATTTEDDEIKTELPDLTPPRRNGLDKIIFTLAALSLFGVVGWLIRQERFEFLLPETTVTAESEMAQQLQAAQDEEFIAYIQRSLPAIEEQIAQAEANKEQASAPNLNAAVVPPPVTPAPAVPQTIVERVYIPITPGTNVPNVPNSNSSATNPSTTTPSNLSQALIPQPTPLPKPVPNANSGAPAESPVDIALPEAPLNLEPPSLNPGVVPLPLTPVNPAPAATHTLVGLLEAANNSAALFEVDGSTQRIRVGEAIGASGWTLVSVANQKAVIRRNGEIRSIYAGQQF